jgi:putative DNA primase/helicase
MSLLTFLDTCDQAILDCHTNRGCAMPPIPAKPLSQIRPSSVRWLCDRYLQRGRLALLDGDPGVGKSLISIDLAARLSRGEGFLGGSPPERPQVTILLGAEDNTADIVRPRAEAAGADLDRVVAIDESDRVPLFFPESVPYLEELICLYAADLVVIDPIVAFLSQRAAANLDQCVRRALGPLAAVSARTDCAILLVRHLRKAEGGRAIHRGGGSIGFIASARTGLFAAWHPVEKDLGVLSVAKANARTPAESQGYRIKADDLGRPRLEWTGPVALSANELNQSHPSPLRIGDQASAWLQLRLAQGPRRAADLLAEAAAAGIPERTLRRAKDELRIGSKKHRTGDRSEWYWYDPSCVWPKDAPFKRPTAMEQLDIDLFD